MDREDWGSLAAFAVVAEECSFTRAAARLSVSPSARRFRDQGPSGVRHQREPARIIGAAFRATESSG